MTGIIGGFLWTLECNYGVNRKAESLLVTWIIISFIRLYYREVPRHTTGQRFLANIFNADFCPYRQEKIKNLMNSSCCLCVYVCSHYNVCFREVFMNASPAPYFLLANVWDGIGTSGIQFRVLECRSYDNRSWKNMLSSFLIECVIGAWRPLKDFPQISVRRRNNWNIAARRVTTLLHTVCRLCL
jgi:hypothetical protein